MGKPYPKATLHASSRMKQLIIMRRDLNLPAGKAIAQGAHASVWALENIRSYGGGKSLIDFWNEQGVTKIVLGVDSEQELLDLAKALGEAKMFPALVHDAGHTILEAGTLTCLGVGPLPAGVLDPITGSLSLY